ADTSAQATVDGWIDRMVKDVPTPGTGHYGESFVSKNGKFTDVVAIPHLWEATLTYLALMASDPSSEFARPELATLDVTPAPPVSDSRYSRRWATELPSHRQVAVAPPGAGNTPWILIPAGKFGSAACARDQNSDGLLMVWLTITNMVSSVSPLVVQKLPPRNRS